MIMGMGLSPLPHSDEMEPFVRKCHVHFPLKQCTLGRGPTLGGHQSAQVNDGEMESAPFSVFVRQMTIRRALKEREGETTVYASTRLQKQMRCCPRHRGLPLLREREISSNATMIPVNGPRVTTYCDPPKQNKNLISLQMKAVILKAPELGHSHRSVRSVPASH